MGKMIAKGRNFSVSAYFPARLAFTPEGNAKEKLINRLAKESNGLCVGSGTLFAGKRPLRDVQFMFRVRADATKFLHKLASRHIRRSGISNFS